MTDRAEHGVTPVTEAERHSCADHEPCEGCVVGLRCGIHDGDPQPLSRLVTVAQALAALDRIPTHRQRVELGGDGQPARVGRKNPRRPEFVLADARDAIATLDAATPRPELVEALRVALDRLTSYVDTSSQSDGETADEDRDFIREARALASGTGEPGLDERERCGVHTFIALEDCEVHGPLANDKGADPTPEPK